LSAGADDIVVTTDAIVEGVHFLADDPPQTVACKALRVNLSDLAAKGATPAGFVLTLALRDVNEAWLAPFAQALGEDAVLFGCPLLGGDTVSTPGPLMISITAFGRVPAQQMIRRSTARPGDRVVVTGTIGDAAMGLDLLKGGVVGAALVADAAARDALVHRYRVPQPRVALARAVRDHASAAMDVSDGLMGDLAKLCAASAVSASIEAESVPLSAPVRWMLDQRRIGIEALVSGGDDYEILCTVPENRLESFQAAAASVDVPVMVIGAVVEGSTGARLFDGMREIALSRLSYSHF